MMTNKNEVENDKHLNMSFCEFLEALARCADKFDLEHLQDNFPEFKNKNPYSLDKKLESIVIKICKANMIPK